MASGAAPQDLMPALGTVLWRDGGFVVLVENTVYRVAP
jgi:hypothetical protein